MLYVIMASSWAITAVDINENQVPGAVLESGKLPEAHSVTQLKRWLQCRGQKQSGKKAELVERVKICQQQQLKIHPALDNRRWYEETRKRNNSSPHQLNQLPQQGPLPLFPVVGWKDFASVAIPKKFSYGSIYDHLITTAVITTTSGINDSDEENCDPEFRTSKPLRKGRQYFVSGHVKHMRHCVTAGGAYYCPKSDVVSSYKTNTMYKVMTMLNMDTAKVVDSSCECAASAMGRCSHVAALLFALEDYTTLFGYGPAACTSKTCGWNQGRKKKESHAIFETPYNTKRKHKHRSEFTPEQGVSYIETEERNYLLGDIAYGNVTTMWDLLMDFWYEDYPLTLERKQELVALTELLLHNMGGGATGPMEVPKTTQQADCNKWHALRKLLITASDCKKVNSATPMQFQKIVAEKLWENNPFQGNKYTEHGKKYEATALLGYTTETGNDVASTGLWVNSRLPGLGASPDGLVYDKQTKSEGLMEIKCPYVLKTLQPYEVAKLTTQQQSAFCCNVTADNVLKLKEGHKYYYQIQMQMAVVEKPWCDFVIWTFKGISIQRICFDKNFWASIGAKSAALYQNVMGPEIFEMRMPRKLSPFNLSDCK